MTTPTPPRHHPKKKWSSKPAACARKTTSSSRTSGLTRAYGDPTAANQPGQCGPGISGQHRPAQTERTDIQEQHAISGRAGRPVSSRSLQATHATNCKLANSLLAKQRACRMSWLQLNKTPDTHPVADHQLENGAGSYWKGHYLTELKRWWSGAPGGDMHEALEEK